MSDPETTSRGLAIQGWCSELVFVAALVAAGVSFEGWKAVEVLETYHYALADAAGATQAEGQEKDVVT